MHDLHEKGDGNLDRLYGRGFDSNRFGPPDHARRLIVRSVDKCPALV
jgi:hypothetical protein